MEAQSKSVISMTVLVGYCIVTILLMVLMTVSCLRRRSRSEERHLLHQSRGDSKFDRRPSPTQSGSIDIRQQARRMSRRAHRGRPPHREVEEEMMVLESSTTSSETVEASNDEAQRYSLQQISSPESAQALELSDLREVIRAVWPARLQWYLIGIQLGLQIVELNVIRQNHQNPKNITEECTIDMLRAWLRQEGTTWTELISALQDETVGHGQLARQIAARQNLGHIEVPGISSPQTAMVSPETFPTDLAQIRSNSDLSFENLDTRNLTDIQIRNLKARLRRDTRKIITAFSDLVIHMRQSFERENVSPQALVLTIKGIALYEQSTRSLLNLRDVTSIDMLVAHLLENCYISFINYFLVAHMIKYHGTELDKRKLGEYKTLFQEYCRRSIFQVPQDVFGPVPSGGEKLAFKVDDNSILLDSVSHTASAVVRSSEISLGDAQFIQENISEALDLEVGSLLLVGVSEGCVELTFVAPKVVIKQIPSRLEVNGPVYRILEKKGVHILCGPPGKPQATKKENICYRLDWTKPQYQGFHPIQHYKIHYVSKYDQPRLWRTFETNDPTESVVVPEEIIHPQDVPFIFKVQAVTEIGFGVCSEDSDPVVLCTEYTPPSKYSRALPRAQHSEKHPLTIDDLQYLMDKLKTAQKEWYKIGLKLGLNTTTLEALERKYETSNICLRHMLNTWLKQSDATREALISALNQLQLYHASTSISHYSSVTDSPSRV